MKRKYLPIIFGLFLFLFTISIVQALTIEELISSYSFDYYGRDLSVSNISDSLISNTLYFDVNVNSAIAGSYVFYIDLEDVNSIISGEAVGNLTSSGGNVRINISTYQLSGRSWFNYTLRIYDSNGSLVYRHGGLKTEENLDYDSGYDVLEIADSNVDNDYILLNASIYSSIAAVENVSVFLEAGDNSFSVTSEENLISGINYVSLQIGDDMMRSMHYKGTYDVTGVLVGEKFIVFDYTTLVYNFEDFIKSSYLKSFNSSFVDSDSDNLIDYIEFNFGGDVKSVGNYRVETDIYDLFGRYLTSINESSNLSVGTGSIIARVDGSLMYSLGINGPYSIDLARLFLNGIEIDSLRDKYITGNISYYDFERPPLSDLTVGLSVDYNGTDYLVNATIKNIGEVAAFNIYVDMFDDFNYSEKVFYDFLDAEESHVFNFVFKNVSLDGLVVIIDSDNLIDEENEDNNVVLYHKNSDDDSDGVENSEDKCLDIVGDNSLTLENEDEDGDGCPDVLGDDDFLENCLSYYTGSAESSINSIDVINGVSDSYLANGRKWFGVSSLLNEDFSLVGFFSNKPEKGKNMNCFFKLSSVISSQETLSVKSNSLKQASVYSEENDDGSLNILREDYNFKLGDGMHIIGKEEYSLENNESSINIKCMNKFAEKTCRKDCVKDKILTKRVCRNTYFDSLHNCRHTQVSCFGDCRKAPRNERRDCMKSCTLESKECRNNNSVNYKNCIRPLKNDEKACNNDCANDYDIEKKYKEEGMQTLSIYDVLDECGYLE